VGGGILGHEFHVGCVLGLHEQGVEFLEPRLHCGNLAFALFYRLLRLAYALLLFLVLGIGNLLLALGLFYRLGLGHYRLCSQCLVDAVGIVGTQIVVDATEVLAHMALAELIDLGDQTVEEFAVVAHDDGCAVEGADGLFEHILGLHVQVVGGLVEDEQIDGLHEQAYHGETAALAAAEHLDLLLRGFAAKHECTQEVVDLQAHVAGGYAVYGVVDGDVFVEQLGLVLGKIADLHVVAYLEGAVEGDFAHDTLDECRLALAVLAHKGHLLAALDGERHAREDVVVTVGLGYLVADDGIVAAAQTWGELEVHGRIVDLVNLDGNYLLQLLEAALHLHGFGGLVAETLYKVLDVGYLFLLVLVGAQLLLTALGAQYDILVVLDLVVFDVAAGYLDGAVGDIVDEGAVVAHQHHGFGRLGEKLLKPLYALDVEVVGRLVEQEHVGLLQENLGELDAHAPATGELARGAVEVAALEAQTGEGALEGGFVVVAAEHHVAVVLESELLDQLGIALALVVGAVGHLLLQPLDALFHAGGVDEGFAGLFDDGGVVGEFHHLGQIAYGGVVGDGYGARGGLLLSAEYLEHGRFAGTVLAHERYAVAVVDDETHVMEERAGAELYSEIFYRNHISGLQYACTALSCWGADGRQGVAVCLYIRFNYSSRSGHDAQTRRRDFC